MTNLPCKNPSCASDGRPHPNCHCYDRMAAGGRVAHFCAEDRAHTPGCEYFAAGGGVKPPAAPAPQAPDDVEGSLGLAGAHHGLLGNLRDVGHPTMAEPEKHERVIKDAQNQHAWRAQPTEEGPKRTLGTRLGDRLADGDHEGAAELVQGHPLFGRAGKNDLKLITARLSHPLLTKEADPVALRAASDYLHSTIKGDNALNQSVNHFFEGKSDREPDREKREKLEKHLDDLAENPEKMLETGGRLGHYLPEHADALAAHAATATNYLRGLKPERQQLGPLDEPTPVSKAAQAQYQRQLSIAADPLRVLEHAKDGTLVPQDVTTLQTLYPGLQKRLVSAATARLIKAKADGHELTYREKQGLSGLLGQPLDFTQTQGAMQAIMKAAGPQQAANQQKAQPKKKSATAAELKAIEKADTLYETPLERRQIDKKA